MSMSIKHPYISFYNWNMWLKHMQHCLLFHVSLYICIWAWVNTCKWWMWVTKTYQLHLWWLVEQCSWRSFWLIKYVSDVIHVDLDCSKCDQCMKWVCDLTNRLNMFRRSLWTTLVFMVKGNLVTKPKFKCISSFECSMFDQVWTMC